MARRGERGRQIVTVQDVAQAKAMIKTGSRFQFGVASEDPLPCLIIIFGSPFRTYTIHNNRYFVAAAARQGDEWYI